MPQAVHVSTPSRLHFGLLRFDDAEGGSFAGLGMMIDKPRVRLRMIPATEWQAAGPSATRALQLARQAVSLLPNNEGPQALKIEVLTTPPEHVGLGSGTQLALAVASAVRSACNLPQPELDELVEGMERGRRSSVGSHGFRRGGLILDAGHHSHAPLGLLHQRVNAPSDWQVLLITPRDEQGCHGQRESEAFGQLESIPPVISKQLHYLAEQEILPAAQNHDAERFDESVYQYGLIAGNCFTPVQGGPFASEQIAQRIRLLRQMGVSGVGQSSWGPMIFAMIRNQPAEELIARLSRHEQFANCDFTVTAPDNTGAVVSYDDA